MALDARPRPRSRSVPKTGTVTADLDALLRERAGDATEILPFVGVEPNPDAVQVAESTHPSMIWIQDTLSGLIEHPEASAALDRTFDLIIDRGYPLLIKDAEQAQSEAEAVAALIAAGGVVIHIVTRAEYAESAHLTCADWDQSLFEIRAAALGQSGSTTPSRTGACTGSRPAHSG